MSVLNYSIEVIKKFLKWSGKLAAEQIEANKQQKLLKYIENGFENHVYETLKKIESYVDLDSAIAENGRKVYNSINDNYFRNLSWGKYYQMMGIKLNKSVNLEVLEDVQTAFASDNVYPGYRFYVTKKTDSLGVCALIFVMIEKDKVNDFDVYLHNLKI